MRIGICAYWFNRGQGVVARQIRSALDGLGHETFILARPTRATDMRPAFIDRTGVWDQPGITAASSYQITPEELVAWGRENELQLALFDQNRRFDAISALRRSGVRTIGRFVWEQFSPAHVEGSKRAFDLIYSLTACERERYAAFGIDSPKVSWGIHPELLAYAKRPGEQVKANRGGSGREVEQPTGITFFFPGGFLRDRKPVPQLLRAFRRVPGDARLLIKGQVERKLGLLERGIARDARVEVILADLPMDEHLRLFASADVCVAPSRWEGLGLHLYESMALGLPVITNDNPPMNEVIQDGENGILVRGYRRRRATSGIPAYLPSVRGLAGAMREALDSETLEKLKRGVAATRDRLAWEHTVAGFAALIKAVL